MADINITKYTDRTNRASRLIAEVLKSSRGLSSVDVTLIAITDDVSVVIKKAPAYVLKTVFEHRDDIGYVLSIESGGVKAVMV